MGFSGKGLYKILSQDSTYTLFISDIYPNTAVNYTYCDLIDLTSVRSLLEKVKPDTIFHFVLYHFYLIDICKLKLYQNLCAPQKRF